ncbi:hypothetical protein [Paraherbaspirillum soli]|uniref:Uncharacterized protein n=1 Tax=Paraherbaspirillum soli TaxID=631222 RepID=A0ABW0MBZ5_9BURK
MGTQNWNGGNRLTVSQGNSLQAVNVIVNPINVAFLYNSTTAAQAVPVTYIGSNQYVSVLTAPETTGNQGSAAILTFSGASPNINGSSSLTASITPSAGSGVQAESWLGSQSMPTNTTGLNNQQLQANGDSKPFNKYSRYYFVPSAQHYNLNVTSGINAFYFALFNASGQVTIYVLNAPDTSYQPIVQQFDGDTYAAQNTKVVVLTSSSVNITLFGNNQQWVAMNADSLNDSTNVSITLTSLG